jgi:hypothetical protein
MLLGRLFKNLTLTNDEWDQLYKDFEDAVPKWQICRKYHIKTGYYKVLKKYVMGEIR